MWRCMIPIQIFRKFSRDRNPTLGLELAPRLNDSFRLPPTNTQGQEQDPQENPLTIQVSLDRSQPSPLQQDLKP